MISEQCFRIIRFSNVKATKFGRFDIIFFTEYSVILCSPLAHAQLLPGRSLCYSEASVVAHVASLLCSSFELVEYTESAFERPANTGGWAVGATTDVNIVPLFK